MNGIIPLWKPKRMTSHDCVMKIRKILRMKKVGHTGTLDPDVAGVLPICIGEATKIIPFLKGKKRYIAQVFVGKATETEDSSGKIIAEEVIIHPFSNDDIDHVLQQFLGEIVQVPPMYSAVKVKGKRLYEYARENIEVERPKRTAIIYDISRIDDQSHHLPSNEFRFQVTCSKGTYIRTLCVDIGKALGYPAHMSYLERIESDYIKKDETVTFDQIEQSIIDDTIENILLPIDHCISHLDTIQVNEQLKRRVLNGQKLISDDFNVKTDPFIIKHNHHLLAIYTLDESEKKIKPVRVFNVNKSEGEQT